MSEHEKMKAAFFAEFDRLGEDHIRLMLQSPPTGTSVHYKMRRNAATEWLAQFDQDARLRSEASQSESLETAKSAKDAAWAAANAARDAAREANSANVIATLALIAAVIAIAASVIAAFLAS